MNKKILKIGLGIILVATVVSAISLLSLKTPSKAVKATSEPHIGNSGNDAAQWQEFKKFDGYQTKLDPQKISPGANPVGQNTYVNNGDRISIRDFGYTIFPNNATESASGTPITSLYTFKQRNGTNIMLRSFDTVLEYYAEKIGYWENLKTGFTANQTFGFADHNTNVDQASYVYFGNAKENYQRWTGNISKLTADVPVGTTTLNVDLAMAFPVSSTQQVVLCGNVVSSTAFTTTTITVATTTFTCATGHGVAQVPTEFPAAPKGNILIVMNTRMFVAGVASSTQTLFYSKIADATDFTFSGVRVAGDGGVINMPEGGGGIVGLIQDQQNLYALKNSLIKMVTFSQDANDLPTILPLKSFDNKSDAVGGISSKAVFSGQNGIYFVTRDNDIVNLAQVNAQTYPQTSFISDTIRPTVESMVFSSSTGIMWQGNLYLSAKQSKTSVHNDVILVYNIETGSWDSPIIGINANDFTIATFGGVTKLYYGNSFSPNAYEITDVPNDNGYALTANWRSREETFGKSNVLKSIDNFYVEGYISDNTQLSITLLYDEDGFTQTQTTILKGDEQNNKYRFTKLFFNMFGLNPFGFERFGTNATFIQKKKFRVYLPTNRVPFYSVQVEFASSNVDDQWEVLNYAFHVMLENQEMRTGLIRGWK